MKYGVTREAKDRSVLTVSQVGFALSGGEVTTDLPVLTIPAGVVLEFSDQRDGTHLLVITGQGGDPASQEFAIEHKGKGVLASESTVNSWLEVFDL